MNPASIGVAETIFRGPALLLRVPDGGLDRCDDFFAIIRVKSLVPPIYFEWNLFRRIPEGGFQTRVPEQLSAGGIPFPDHIVGGPFQDPVFLFFGQQFLVGAPSILERLDHIPAGFFDKAGMSRRKIELRQEQGHNSERGIERPGPSNQFAVALADPFPTEAGFHLLHQGEDDSPGGGLNVVVANRQIQSPQDLAAGSFYRDSDAGPSNVSLLKVLGPDQHYGPASRQTGPDSIAADIALLPARPLEDIGFQAGNRVHLLAQQMQNSSAGVGERQHVRLARESSVRLRDQRETRPDQGLALLTHPGQGFHIHFLQGRFYRIHTITPAAFPRFDNDRPDERGCLARDHILVT